MNYILLVIHFIPHFIKFGISLSSMLLRLLKFKNSSNIEYMNPKMIGTEFLAASVLYSIGTFELDVVYQIDRGIQHLVICAANRVIGIFCCYPYWKHFNSLKIITIGEYIDQRYESKFLTSVFHLFTAIFLLISLSNYMSGRQALYFKIDEWGGSIISALMSLFVTMCITMGGMRSVLISGIIDFLFSVVSHIMLIVQLTQFVSLSKSFSMTDWPFLPISTGMCYFSTGISVFTSTLIHGLTLQVYYEIFKFAQQPTQEKIMLATCLFLYTSNIIVVGVSVVILLLFGKARNCFTTNSQLKNSQLALINSALERIQQTNLRQIIISGISLEVFKQMGISVFALIRQVNSSCQGIISKINTTNNPTDQYTISWSLSAIFGFLISISLLMATFMKSTGTVLIVERAISYGCMPVFISLVIMGPIFPHVTHSCVKWSSLIVIILATIITDTFTENADYFKFNERANHLIYYSINCTQVPAQTDKKFCIMQYFSELLPLLFVIVNIFLTIVLSLMFGGQQNFNRRLYFTKCANYWASIGKEKSESYDDSDASDLS